MSGLRFKVGELAIYAVNWCTDDAEFLNRRCEIGMVGPIAPGQLYFNHCGEACYTNTGFDYLADFGEFYVPCRDFQLRKLDPPAEPKSITRREEIEA